MRKIVQTVYLVLQIKIKIIVINICLSLEASSDLNCDVLTCSVLTNNNV